MDWAWAALTAVAVALTLSAVEAEPGLIIAAGLGAYAATALLLAE